MQTWLEEQRRKWRENGGRQGSEEEVSISFPTHKPSAFVSLDDRAITFNGQWPDMDFLRNFKPWHKG
jgi:hypothetical protein